MKKALLLGSLASLAALSFGCALTDYAGQPGTSIGINIPQNKSHGVLSCYTDDRIANTQQTLEAVTRDMLYKTSCTPDPFAPGADPNGFVSAEDARDWNRFIGMFASVTGAGVSGFAPGFDGQWEMAGVKELPDGSRRISTYMSTWTTFTGFPPFSCAFAGNGASFRSGSAEGGVYGESFTSPVAGVPAIPNFHIETIAIDNTQGFGNADGNCANIVAITPLVVSRGGYSTYVGELGRFGEGRLFFTPIVRHAGLAEFLSGQPMTAHVGDVSVTATGNLLADGKIEATLVSLSRNGVTYTAGDTPVKITINPNGSRPTPQVIGNPAEGVKLAQWAIDAGMVDRQLDLGGVQVKEFGITLPELSLTISGSTLSKYISDMANGGADNGSGFGG